MHGNDFDTLNERHHFQLIYNLQVAIVILILLSFSKGGYLCLQAYGHERNTRRTLSVMKVDVFRKNVGVKITALKFGRGGGR